MSKRTDDVVRMIVPGAAAVLGAAAAWMATRRRPSGLRDALPDMPDVGLGDITGDLRERVESVVSRSTGLLTNHKTDNTDKTESRATRVLSADQLEQRRQERAKRRQNRKRSRT